MTDINCILTMISDHLKYIRSADRLMAQKLVFKANDAINMAEKIRVALKATTHPIALDHLVRTRNRYYNCVIAVQKGLV